MTPDPKDDEIARLTVKLEQQAWVLASALQQNEASRVEVVALTAERDAALAQVAKLRAIVEFYENLTGTIGTVAISRRDAQMLAEGRKEGLREAAEIADKAAKINDSENGGKDTPSGNLMWGVVCDILAAAEKEETTLCA